MHCGFKQDFLSVLSDLRAIVLLPTVAIKHRLKLSRYLKLSLDDSPIAYNHANLLPQMREKLLE